MYKCKCICICIFDINIHVYRYGIHIYIYINIYIFMYILYTFIDMYIRTHTHKSPDCYIHLARPIPFPPFSCLVAARMCLWTEWFYVGDLVADTVSSVFVLDVEAFSDAIAGHWAALCEKINHPPIISIFYVYQSLSWVAYDMVGGL